MIEAAGGSVDNKRRRNVEQIREVNKADRDPVYLIITCEHDLHIVTDILKAKIGIFNTAFVMSGPNWALISPRASLQFSTKCFFRSY